MLSREERLTKTKEFAAVYRKRKSVANSLLILYTGKTKKDHIPTKVGFVAGKKVHKSAVKRNKIKRQLRAAYRDITQKEQIYPDYETLIFIARPAIVESEYSRIYDAVKDCLKKANKKFRDIN